MSNIVSGVKRNEDIPEIPSFFFCFFAILGRCHTVLVHKNPVKGADRGKTGVSSSLGNGDF